MPTRSTGASEREVETARLGDEEEGASRTRVRVAPRGGAGNAKEGGSLSWRGRAVRASHRAHAAAIDMEF